MATLANILLRSLIFYIIFVASLKTSSHEDDTSSDVNGSEMRSCTETENSQVIENDPVVRMGGLNQEQKTDTNNGEDDSESDNGEDDSESESDTYDESINQP